MDSGFEHDMRLCHAVPGRCRLKIPCICRSERLRRAIKDRLEQMPGVERAELRPVTGSLIVRYDVDGIALEALLDGLKSGLADLTWQDRSVSARSQKTPAAAHSRGRSSGVLGYYLFNGVALSAFMLYALVKRFFLKSPLSQSPLSLTGLVAMAGAVPLVWRTVRDLRQKRRMGLFPFLTAACVTAVVAGEALAALEVLWVLAIGLLLEEYVTERARRGIRDLLRVTPEKAMVIRNGTPVEVSAAEIRIHETVLVRAGMKIPVDGEVVEGAALVDASHITGRAQPDLCKQGAPVFAGTSVSQGTLHVRADKVGEATFLAHIRRLVEAALSQPTDLEKRADILAARLTRMGLLATFLTFVLTRNLTRSFSVLLVMACPCATVLAASTAIAAAIANAARRQVLIKGGVYLEQVRSMDVICFDKTGTLTGDTQQVTAVYPRAPNQSKDRIIQLAARAEVHATHPMATALLEEARRRKLDVRPPRQAEVFIGRGVAAVAEDDTILVGNRDFLESNGVKTRYFHQRAGAAGAAGQTVLYVAGNGRLQGMVTVDNPPRSGLPSVLKQLRKRGVSEFYLISGDAAPIVRSMARTYGFDHYRGGLLPEEKSALVEELKGDGRKVMMVGDGVNDALVLTRASVGVAMGAGGSDVAVEAADIALLKSDLGDLVFLYALSEQTLRVVEQNFWVATGTNLLGIILAASGWMPPLLTGALHVGHSLGILLNSGRLLRYEPSRAGSDATKVRPDLSES